MEKINNVFHVSMLRRYRLNLSHVVSLETIKLRPNLTYESGTSRDLGSGSERIVEKVDPIGQSDVEKPQDQGSHVGKRRSYAATIPSTVK